MHRQFEGLKFLAHHYHYQNKQIEQMQITLCPETEQAVYVKVMQAAE